MLNWYDLENRADVVTDELAMAEVTARHMEAAGYDEDNEAGTFRRMLASAFVSIGTKLDRDVLEPTRAA
jgi:hypothetical protein